MSANPEVNTSQQEWSWVMNQKNMPYSNPLVQMQCTFQEDLNKPKQHNGWGGNATNQDFQGGELSDFRFYPLDDTMHSQGV